MAEIEYLTVDHLSTKDLIRIFSKISIDPTVSWNGTPCWIWIGSHFKKYGRTHWIKSNHITHRLIWAWLVGPLPKGQKHGELDHLCRRHPCCNPLHLEFVTTSINIQRVRALRTHCKYGHPLSGSNLQFTSKGTRVCRACRHVRAQRVWQNTSTEVRTAHRERLRAWRLEYPEEYKAQIRRNNAKKSKNDAVVTV